MTLYVDWMQPASGDPAINVPASVFRMLAQGLVGVGQSGAIAPASALVTHRAAGANFSVDVQPCCLLVAGTDTTDQGTYVCTNTSVVNVATPAAPGSGTRTHRLVGQVRDKRANGTWGATYDWAPVLLTDPGSGLPNLPASAIDLAHITIAAGQANVSDSNINQNYPVLRGLARVGPWWSFQNNPGSWNGTNAWTNFSIGNWAPITFTVPPSGMVHVTITGSPNTGSAGGNAYIGFGITGGDTRAPLPQYAIGGGGGEHRGSCRRLFTGLTPGATDVVTPAWFLTTAASGHGSDSGDGLLVVEAA